MKCVCICVLQEGYNEVKLLNDVVDISVENEIITDLSEPIRIGFNHDAIPVSLSTFVAFYGSLVFTKTFDGLLPTAQSPVAQKTHWF